MLFYIRNAFCKELEAVIGQKKSKELLRNCPGCDLEPKNPKKPKTLLNEGKGLK